MSILYGVLAILTGSAFMMVAGGYRGVDVWVWDWAPVVITRRGRYGTVWRSPTVMRIQFGVMGAFVLLAGLHLMAL